MIIAILYSAYMMDCRVSFLPWETGNLAFLISSMLHTRGLYCVL